MVIKYDSTTFKKLWRSRLLIRELAERFCCTEQTIHNIAKREGLQEVK